MLLLAVPASLLMLGVLLFLGVRLESMPARLKVRQDNRMARTALAETPDLAIEILPAD